jgi:hypothetical protein
MPFVQQDGIVNHGLRTGISPEPRQRARI